MLKGSLAVGIQEPPRILLEDSVEIGPPEAEGADTSPPWMFAVHSP